MSTVLDDVWGSRFESMNSLGVIYSLVLRKSILGTCPKHHLCACLIQQLANENNQYTQLLMDSEDYNINSSNSKHNHLATIFTLLYASFYSS